MNNNYQYSFTFLFLIKSAFALAKPLVLGLALNLNLTLLALALDVSVEFNGLLYARVLLRLADGVCKSFVLLFVFGLQVANLLVYLAVNAQVDWDVLLFRLSALFYLAQ